MLKKKKLRHKSANMEDDEYQPSNLPENLKKTKISEKKFYPYEIGQWS